MPIDTRCPHCQKAYRLKDELLGRKVKCPNPDCQKPFAVQPAAEAAPKPKPAAAPKKTAADLEREAEALAAALFGEAAGPAGADDTRTVDMVCASCDHQWAVPFAMKGKNVVCPECRFRQRVPDKKEKKIDWRDPNADRPSLARGEEVPDDLRQQMTRSVTDDTLLRTGVIKEDIEPLPLAVKLQRVALALGAVAAVAFVVLYFVQSRKEGKEQRYMDDAVAEMEKVTDDGAAKGQPPLLKAALLAAAAEHALRNDAPDQRKLAVDRLGLARQTVEALPRTPEREAVLGELAVLATRFGGDDEQVGKEIRLRWKPAERAAGAQLTAGLGDVQTELKRVLVALSGADLEFRLSVVRRVTRELARANRHDLLAEVIGQGFPADTAEAVAHMGLTLLRDGDPAGAKALAEQARSLMAGAPSLSAQALCEATGVALKNEEKPFTDPKGGTLGFGNRMYAVTLSAAAKDYAAAAAAAVRDTTQPDEKLRALAAVADWADNPAEAVAKADAVLTGEAKGRSNAPYALLRLAAAAGRGGQLEVADRLTAGIADDGLRAWARAEAVRAKLDGARGQKADAGLVDVPADKAKVRVGHAWTAVTVARHNAAAGGDPAAAAKDYADWPEGALRGCGLAGLALGIQDRKR